MTAIGRRLRLTGMGTVKRRWIESMEPNQEPPMDAQFTQCWLCQTGSYPYFGYVGSGVCDHCGTEWTYDEGDRPTEESLQRLWSKMPRWIPVSERLPETRTNVMAYDGNFPHSMTSFRIVSLTIDCQQWYDAHSDQEFEVDAFTHWMPLPEPPESK